VQSQIHVRTRTNSCLAMEVEMRKERIYQPCDNLTYHGEYHKGHRKCIRERRRRKAGTSAYFNQLSEESRAFLAAQAEEE